MSCSKRKRSELDLRTAMERYDGIYFRVLRRFLREYPEEVGGLDILVLSAQYGLIPGSHPIPTYDRRMTVERAKELSSAVLLSLKEHMKDKSYGEIFLVLGSDYLLALDGFVTLIPPYTTLLQAKGPQGVKASQLKCWLHRIEEQKRKKPVSQVPHRGHALIHGCSIRMSANQVIAHVRESVKTGAEPPAIPRTWFVCVDGKQIGPKWIVRQLTGLPLSSFTSGEARRVLRRLGLEVSANY